MAIDAYYFSHDSNAKDDPNCVLLIEQLGLEGYGIYWVLIELLRDQPGYRYPLVLVPAISRRYNTTNEKMKTVITNYQLFEIENDEFFSLSLIKRMEHLDSKRKQASIAGKRSAEVRMLNASSTDVQQTFNASSTIKVNESKVNETKPKEIIEDIPYSEIVSYLNSESSSKYKASSSKTRDLIKARWNEGFRINDFTQVIDKKCASWSNDSNMVKFLRPETLFGTKFESYLNEKIIAPITKISAAKGEIAWGKTPSVQDKVTAQWLAMRGNE